MSSFNSACTLSQFYGSQCQGSKFGRITSVAFVDECYEFVDPSDQQEWFDVTCDQSGAPLGVVIHGVSGDMPAQAPIETKSRSGPKTRTTSYDFTVNLQLDYDCTNRDFFNSLNKSQYYKMWFVTNDPKTTKSLLFHSISNVSVTVQTPILPETSDIMEFVLTVKWSEDNAALPCYTPPVAIFDSFRSYESLRTCLTCTPAICSTCP